MKKYLILGALGLLLSTSAEARSYSSGPSDVHVSGYTRNDGTYVSEHYRSAPDRDKDNNYGNGDN